MNDQNRRSADRPNNREQGPQWLAIFLLVTSAWLIGMGIKLMIAGWLS